MDRATLLILLCLPLQALACSFSLDYRSKPFLVHPPYDESKIPPKPIVSVASIKRGFDDGNFASCSDAGIIELKVSTDTIGYDIEVIEPEEHRGTIPDGLYGAVREGDDYFIRFIWLDGSSNVQEPLSIKLAIKATSISGGISEPIQLIVEHPGGVSH